MVDVKIGDNFVQEIRPPTFELWQNPAPIPSYSYTVFQTTKEHYKEEIKIADGQSNLYELSYTPIRDSFTGCLRLDVLIDGKELIISGEYYSNSAGDYLSHLHIVEFNQTPPEGSILKFKYWFRA